MSEPVVVLTTWPASNSHVKEKFLRPLLDERLIACANVFPVMQSVYMWKGEFCDDNEFQLVLKTTKASVAKLQGRLKELHPYECPEFLVLAASASSDYAAFLNKQQE